MDHFSLLLLSRDCCCIFSVQLLSCLMTSFTVEYEFHLLGSSSKPAILSSQPDQPVRESESERVTERLSEIVSGRHLRRYSRLNQKMQIASTSASRGLSSVCWFSGLLGDATIFSSLLIFNTFVCCAPKGKTSCSKADEFSEQFQTAF